MKVSIDLLWNKFDMNGPIGEPYHVELTKTSPKTKGGLCRTVVVDVEGRHITHGDRFEKRRPKLGLALIKVEGGYTSADGESSYDADGKMISNVNYEVDV